MFLLFDFWEQDQRYIGFGSLDGLKMLGKASQWHLDGTFKASPRLYYQLLVIHAWLNGQMIPALFVLMPDKTERSYKLIIARLKEMTIQNRIHLNPTVIVSDFELAILNAVQFHFPNVQLKGCMFHFTQAIWKNIQLIGKYQNN